MCLLVAWLLNGCASAVDPIGATGPWQAGVSMRVARAAHAVAGNSKVIYALCVGIGISNAFFQESSEIYEKLGFEVVEKKPLPATSNVFNWGMLRRPKN